MRPGIRNEDERIGAALIPLPSMGDRAIVARHTLEWRAVALATSENGPRLAGHSREMYWERPSAFPTQGASRWHARTPLRPPDPRPPRRRSPPWRWPSNRMPPRDSLPRLPRRRCRRRLPPARRADPPPPP